MITKAIIPVGLGYAYAADYQINRKVYAAGGDAAGG